MTSDRDLIVTRRHAGVTSDRDRDLIVSHRHNHGHESRRMASYGRLPA